MYEHTCLQMCVVPVCVHVAKGLDVYIVECGGDYGLLTYLRVWSKHPLI